MCLFLCLFLRTVSRKSSATAMPCVLALNEVSCTLSILPCGNSRHSRQATTQPFSLSGLAAASSASSLQKFLFIVAERSQAPNVRACQGTRVAAAGPVTRRAAAAAQSSRQSRCHYHFVVLSFCPSFILSFCQSESLKSVSCSALRRA